MQHDLTKGNITRNLVLFALPMMAGNVLQQLYNIADTLIVGRALGRDALAAVGSAYALMTFLTSVFIRLSMSAVLTAVSLGTRVALAYILAEPIGEVGIWLSVPIGRLLADAIGFCRYFMKKQKLLPNDAADSGDSNTQINAEA